jgi:hypothetical protein
MRHTLPALHEGHAPIFLHNAFQDALDAFEDWAAGAPEPVVDCDGQPSPISSVFGRMRTCTDVMPVRVLGDVQAVLKDPKGELFGDAQPTYAEAARILRAHCVERLKA